PTAASLIWTASKPDSTPEPKSYYCATHTTPWAGSLLNKNSLTWQTLPTNMTPWCYLMKSTLPWSITAWSSRPGSLCLIRHGKPGSRCIPQPSPGILLASNAVSPFDQHPGRGLLNLTLRCHAPTQDSGNC